MSSSKASSEKTRASGAVASGSAPPELSDLHCFTETNGVITTTMFDIPGYRVVRVLGAVYGLTVRSRNWAVGFGMVLKSIAGGELRWFTNLVTSRAPSLSQLPASPPKLPSAHTFVFSADQSRPGGNRSSIRPATMPSRASCTSASPAAATPSSRWASMPVNWAASRRSAPMVPPASSKRSMTSCPSTRSWSGTRETGGCNHKDKHPDWAVEVEGDTAYFY